jgi:quinol monooxygenase YgiN
VDQALARGVASAEVNVVVVTLSGYARSSEVVSKLCRFATQGSGRTRWIGWLRGRCFVDTTNPSRFFLYQEWISRRHWEAWYHSAPRQRALRDLQPMLDGDLQIEVYEEF